MKYCIILLLLLIATAGTVRSQLNLKFEKYRLPNGLDVILREDHSVPTVSVNIWYHVGSVREKPGRTGFAHLFEHVMFQGSKDVAKGEHFKLIQEVGGTLNGSTTTDRTNYFETVPSNYLPMILWLESDRMGFLLDNLTQENLDNQRDVVKNERRQNYENVPYGLADEKIAAALLPPTYPYSWLTIGSQEDLSKASLEDVKDFFRTWYRPNNASLSIVGDFKPSEAKALVKKYFGGLTGGKRLPGPKAPMPSLNVDKYIVMEDRVQLPRAYYSWITPKFGTYDDAVLDIISEILAGDISSRLQKALMYDRQIAQDVTAYEYSRELSSMFEIIVTAKEGVPLASIDTVVRTELKKLQTDGPGAKELERAKNTTRAGFIYPLESMANVADLLNNYNTRFGDPGYFKTDIRNHQKVTASDVKRVAAAYLKFPGCVVLSVVPQGKPELQVAK